MINLYCFTRKIPEDHHGFWGFFGACFFSQIHGKWRIKCHFSLMGQGFFEFGEVGEKCELIVAGATEYDQIQESAT